MRLPVDELLHRKTSPSSETSTPQRPRDRRMRDARGGAALPQEALGIGFAHRRSRDASTTLTATLLAGPQILAQIHGAHAAGADRVHDSH